MKVAVPVWEGRVSPVFDTARNLVCVDIEAGVAQGRREVPIEASAPHERVSQVKQAGVDVLICGAISRPLDTMLRMEGIRIIPFVAGGIDDVLEAYATGRMNESAFAMPGCCGWRRRWRRGGSS